VISLWRIFAIFQSIYIYIYLSFKEFSFANSLIFLAQKKAMKEKENPQKSPQLPTILKGA